ncbi:MAG: DUF3347 domain-containing protein [Sphingobacteriales bacterium]|nr:MAG: DUF3347 domain-containing protein [Sphingobacteriales bacterium]
MKRILGIAILTVLMACNQSKNNADQKIDSTNSDLPTVKSQVLIKDVKKTSIFNDYEDLKNALVDSDSSKAQKSAQVLEKSLDDYEGCETTASIAKKISETTDLADQRKDFTALSMDLIAFIKSSEIEKGTIYVQHCPMANKGDGGDWLSTEKDIKNPYYGKEMLTCGRVVEEIKGK